MNFLRRLFPVRIVREIVYTPSPGAFSSILTFPPRLHASYPKQHPREYVRIMQLKAKSWKHRNRNSAYYEQAKTEARITEWAYHTWRHGVDASLLEIRIKNYPKAWPFYSATEWAKAAKQILQSFETYPRMVRK